VHEQYDRLVKRDFKLAATTSNATDAGSVGEQLAEQVRWRVIVIEPVDDTLYCVDIRSCHNDAPMSPVHHSTSAVAGFDQTKLTVL